MQTYTHYKDSGIDWIGQIPEHWELAPNKFIFNLKKNQVGKRSSEYDLLSLTLRGIIKRDMENPEGKFPAEFDTYQEVKINDFVFCLFDVEETPRTVGLSNYDGMITGAYTVMEPIGENFAPFLYYYYLNADDKKQLKFLYRGLRNTIPKDSFFSLKTALPPIQEQEAIANFLDEKTAKIDALVQTKEQQIEKLKELRQAKIHQAVTKGLDANVPTKDSGVDWIGEIPAHWEVVPMRRIYFITDGTHDTPLYVDKSEINYPLITSKDFINGKVSFDDCKYILEKDFLEINKRSEVAYADVLMSMIGGNIGKSVIINTNRKFSVKNVAIFKCNKVEYKSKILLYYLESGLLDIQIKLKSRGGAQGFLSLNDIKNLIFYKITPHEQEQIVAYLDEVTGKIDQAIAQKQEQITKLKEYKQSLINDVVTGKVKVALGEK